VTVVLDFTSGEIVSYGNYMGITTYREKGVTVNAVAPPGEYLPDWPFWLREGSLNMAMESYAVEFSTGGIPFQLVSLNIDSMGTQWDQYFESSTGASIVVNVDGVYTPRTSEGADRSSRAAPFQDQGHRHRSGASEGADEPPRAEPRWYPGHQGWDQRVEEGITELQD
jgi:hypothetical protein